MRAAPEVRMIEAGLVAWRMITKGSDFNCQSQGGWPEIWGHGWTRGWAGVVTTAIKPTTNIHIWKGWLGVEKATGGCDAVNFFVSSTGSGGG